MQSKKCNNMNHAFILVHEGNYALTCIIYINNLLGYSITRNIIAYNIQLYKCM